MTQEDNMLTIIGNSEQRGLNYRAPSGSMQPLLADQQQFFDVCLHYKKAAEVHAANTSNRKRPSFFTRILVPVLPGSSKSPSQVLAVAPLIQCK